MADVVLVEELVKLPKEMNEVRTALVGLLKDIKAKKPIAELAAANLPLLMAAVDGFSQLDDEAKLGESFNVYGLLVADVAKALSGK